MDDHQNNNIEMYDDLQILIDTLANFRKKYPNNNFTNDFFGRSSPGVLATLKNQLPNFPILWQIADLCGNVLGTKKQYLKEQEFMNNPSTVPLDKYLPDDLLSLVTDFLETKELNSLADVSFIFRKVACLDSRMSLSIPCFSSSQYNCMKKFGPLMQEIDTKLFMWHAFSLHQLKEIVKTWQNCHTLKLYGSVEQQKYVLKLAHEFALPIKKLVINCPQEATYCSKTMMQPFSKIDLTGVKISAQTIEFIAPPPKQKQYPEIIIDNLDMLIECYAHNAILSTNGVFSNLKILTALYLLGNINFSNNKNVSFPSLENLTIGRMNNYDASDFPKLQDIVLDFLPFQIDDGINRACYTFSSILLPAIIWECRQTLTSVIFKTWNSNMSLLLQVCSNSSDDDQPHVNIDQKSSEWLDKIKSENNNIIDIKGEVYILKAGPFTKITPVLPSNMQLIKFEESYKPRNFFEADRGSYSRPA